MPNQTTIDPSQNRRAFGRQLCPDFPDIPQNPSSELRSTRRPGPTAIAGFGVVLWLLAAARKRSKHGVHDVTLHFRESSSSLVDTATRVFRERAETKQREFMVAAQTYVAKGAAMLSDATERKLEDVIDRVLGGPEVRPAHRIDDAGGARECAGLPHAKVAAPAFALEAGAAGKT